MNILVPIIVILILGLFSFFLSASETALISLNKIRIRFLLNQGSRRAKVIYRLISRLDRLITSILVGNNFVNVAISALGAAIFIQLLGQRWGVVISTLVITFFILVFCEITPKILAIKFPEKVSLNLAYPIDIMIRMMRPLTLFFTAIGTGILRLFKIEPSKRSALVTEEEIRLMVEVGKEEGVLLEDERRLIHRIFEFGDALVKEVMVAREKMVCIELNTGGEWLLDLLIEEGHTRIPVYKDRIDNIVGVVYARDLPFMWRNGSLIIIADIMHPVHFVLPQKKVHELLRDFQRMKIQIAIVSDESGKVLGLVTLEDILEEIVGEIEERPQ